MGKSEGKIEPLILLRLISISAFITFSSWTLLLVLHNFHGPTVLTLLILNSLIFAVGNAWKKESFVLAGWVGVSVLFVAAQVFLLPDISYFSALAWVMVMLVFVDLAHFLGILHQLDVAGARSGDESARTWSLLRRHLSFVNVLAVLSYVISLVVINLSPPIQFTFNPVIGIVIFASAALLIVAGLASEKRVRPTA